MKISVITICYNAEKELHATFESVRKQDQACFEYVVIDGASNDASQTLFSESEDIIDLLISEPDEGIYDAMNKGMANSKGDYFWFMNAGDTFYSSDTIRLVHQKLAQGNLRGIYGDAMLVDANYRELGLRRGSAPSTLQTGSLKFGMDVCHQAFVVHRDCAPEYDLQYKIAADIDWMIKILKSCGPFHKHDIIYCNFLEGGFSSEVFRKSWKERFRVLTKHYGLFPNLMNHLYISMRFLVQKLKS